MFNLFLISIISSIVNPVKLAISSIVIPFSRAFWTTLVFPLISPSIIPSSFDVSIEF
jgi:hypothetical protein